MDSDTTFRHTTVSGAQPRLLAVIVNPSMVLGFLLFEDEMVGTVADVKDLVKAIP